MATPDQQWSLGTAALNGADGDTARTAATKYNAHSHQTTDVQAALDGAASPSESNVFATMDDIPSGSGATISSITIDSGNVGAGTSTDIDAPLDSSNIIIVGAEVILTAGTSTAVGVTLYNTNAFSTFQVGVFGDAFSTITIGADPIYGPRVQSAVTLAYAAPYHDYDDADELHVRVTNGDFSNDGTFQIKLKYISLGAY